MCDFDNDGERSAVWCETPRKARKSHLCDCCGGQIQRGERYLRHFSLYDGNTTSEKICLPCDQDRETFSKAHGGYTGSPGYFPEMLHNCIAEGDEESEKAWKPMLELIHGRSKRSSGPATSC